MYFGLVSFAQFFCVLTCSMYFAYTCFVFFSCVFLCVCCVLYAYVLFVVFFVCLLLCFSSLSLFLFLCAAVRFCVVLCPCSIWLCFCSRCIGLDRPIVVPSSSWFLLVKESACRVVLNELVLMSSCLHTPARDMLLH